MIKRFIWGINPKALSPIADESEGPDRGFIFQIQARRARVYTVLDQALESLCIIKIDSTERR